MWNGGVPYRLKLYIDIITQPGLLFGFDPAKGYVGLLKGKSATVVYSSGVFAPGVPASFGVDFHSNYLDWWLVAAFHWRREHPHHSLSAVALDCRSCQRSGKCHG